MIRLAILLVLSVPCWGRDAVLELTDSRLRAADIFEGADAEIDLGPAPAPGAVRRVTRPQLLRWARQYGIAAAPEDLPELLTLSRKLRRWPATEAAETLQSLLATEAGVDPASVAVELVGFAEPEIPAGPLEWSLPGLPGDLAKPVRIALRWKDAGGRSGVESVTAEVRVRAAVLTARADLRAGEAAGPQDFRRKEVDLPEFRHRYQMTLEKDEHYILKRELNAGELLCAVCIERRPDIERGALVELLVTAGPIRLRAPGRAEGAGSAGDLVPFRNLASNQRVLARVWDSKTAEVIAQ